MSKVRDHCVSSVTDLPFFFDARHTALAAMARRLAMDVFAPAEESHSGDLADRCRAIAHTLADARLLDAIIPTVGARAGSVDVRSICVVRELLAWGSPLAEFVFAMQGLGTYPIALAGTDAQRAEFLPPVVAGSTLAAFAITEEEAGSDVGALATRAVRHGAEWVIDGSKTFISNAGIAGHYVVFAKTRADAGNKGISAFVVRPEDPGFHFDGPIALIADHPLGSLRFDGLRIPATRLLGNEGDGFKIAMATLDVFRSTVGAAAVGMAHRALDEALARVTVRKQFGQALSEFQTTRYYLAEMATDLDAARLLVYRAAYVRDHGAERITLEASMAKMFATESAQRIIDRALQLHGGSGVVRGSVVERLYREVRALRIYEGTTEIQRLVIGGLLTDGERARVSTATRE